MGDSPVKRPLGTGHGKQRADAHPSRRLAKDDDIARITTEGGDLLLALRLTCSLLGGTLCLTLLFGPPLRPACMGLHLLRARSSTTSGYAESVPLFALLIYGLASSDGLVAAVVSLPAN